jgi:hypothetical protein
MKLKADIKYKSNWQQGTLKGVVFRIVYDISELTFYFLQPKDATSGFAL